VHLFQFTASNAACLLLYRQQMPLLLLLLLCINTIACRQLPGQRLIMSRKCGAQQRSLRDYGNMPL
jgi:hypothetical protein